MAHVVGVPKRDPCHKCDLPVFLAERLTIGKRIYHRTCLKCARCSSQLTPGSFYETEVDGEYCCETCPDEETSVSKIGIGAGDDEKVTSGSKTSPSSIAERLAFFENDGKKLLQKSLSDEEKSQSLKKITETHKNIYKHNSALSNFMNSHLSDTTDSASPADLGRSNESSRRNSASTTSSTTSGMDDELSEDHQVPDLPTTLPPSMINEMDTSAGSSSNMNKPRSYESTLTLSFDNVNNRSLETSTPTSILDATEQVASDNVEQSEEKEEEEENVIKPPTQLPSTLSTEKSKIDLNLNDKMNVTKDISDTDEKMRTTTTITTNTTKASPTIATISTTSDKFDEISQNNNNRSSMVRARLHQFEIISKDNSPSSSINSSNSSSSKEISVNHTKSSSIITVDDDDNNEYKPLETEVPKIVIKNNNEINDSLKDNSNEINQVQEASYQKRSEVEEDSVQQLQEQVQHESSKMPVRTASIANLIEDYPEELNPFQSDEEVEEEKKAEKEIIEIRTKCDESDEELSKIENRKSLNPFDSSDDESQQASEDTPKKIKPPRPPPPKILSTNPFGSDNDDDDEKTGDLVETQKRIPVPTPRSHVNTSQNPTPEPTPRLSRQLYSTPLKNSGEYYGSNSSLTTTSSGLHVPSEFLRRGSDGRGSSHSIGSSNGSLSSGKYKKAKKAPAPPKPSQTTIKELFPPLVNEEQNSSPSSSVATTPQPRKKRPAPAPPSSIESTVIHAQPTESVNPITPPNLSPVLLKSSDIHDLKVTDDKLSDEEKLKETAVTEDKLSDEEKLKEAAAATAAGCGISYDQDNKSTRRLITVDSSLLDDSYSSTESRPKEQDSVVYRRKIAALVLDTSVEEEKVMESHNRQLEKLKDNKEAKNRNRQSMISFPSHNEENDPLFNKSVHGKWKRRKGPAPALPVPPKKVLQMLPLQEIRHELEIIEVQQQGLEKQGVMLEKMIRERCEGDIKEELKEEISSNPPTNTKEVEDLILQLFELVNEKNELFRRQAELMYLRRQHRLEQEQADLEYEIRVLMAQPERNKTDSDKAREETLIARLVQVVQLRNEVVDCLEMDRLREAEEDMSIKQRLEMHTAKRDEELSKQTPTKLSKKEKKRQKESKKFGKSKKLDADKDADESELSVEKKEKKKKKNLLSSVIAFK